MASSTVAQAKARECDEATKVQLAARLQKRWPGAEVRFCAPGHFGAAGYVVEVHGDDWARLGIVDKDGGKDLAQFDELRQRAFATSTVGYGAVDLDGDGVDEVVEWWRRSAHGMMGSDNWLDVRRIENGKLGERIAGPHVSIYFPGQGSCFADFKLTAHAIVITVENTRDIPPSDCLPIGTHRFALKNKTLRKLP